MSKTKRVFLAAIFLPLVMTGISLTLVVAVSQDDTWADLVAWFPLAYVIAFLMFSLIGAPAFFLLRAVRTPPIAAYILAGTAAPVLGLSIWLSYLDHWYTLWPYWLSGGVTGFLGWTMFQRSVDS